ncbi:UvrD-helicase domain-containing protein [Desulfococcaceae bacterium HSG9]|nr:UvrD-helicase domain-containing protein [Desulfococcaceae bacterium HSG9]
MKFIADLHIHSHYSISTAKNLDLENIYMAARIKGITVVATGDCTHPAWIAEIKAKLIPAEEGLFQLKDEIASECDKLIPASCNGQVRFILESEISSIYKKNGKVRKNHNLVFHSDLASAERFNTKLDKIGNIKSDGRPILGLDAKHLLEMLLETSDSGFLIPAHIWTPWFSLLGSKSGFDSLEECFEDLTPHIFALETGLSSDPAMNWRISDIDGLTLVSNSDAHSPANLGREANLFDTQLSFPAIRDALRTGDAEQFLGTFEFYPEEGKYHLDGHRKCQVRYEPQDSIKNNGLCPECGKPLTLGVLYRVEELADRPGGAKPDKHHPFYSIIPLKEIISELVGVGPKSKKVQRCYETVLDVLGTEFDILHAIPPETIEDAGIPLLGEAIQRMRCGQVLKSPGYDGEFGKITMFAPGEINRLSGQKTMFSVPGSQSKKKKTKPRKAIKKHSKKTRTTPKAQSPLKENSTSSEAALLSNLNSQQRQAAIDGSDAIMIIAGPGAGKTRTLTHRIAYSVLTSQSAPEKILAVTFTNKAAAEMRERIRILLKDSPTLPQVDTFHGLCLSLLKEYQAEQTLTLIDDRDRKDLVKDVIKQANRQGIIIAWQADKLLEHIIAAKQLILNPQDTLNAVVKKADALFFRPAYTLYQQMLLFQGLCDYEDLIFKTVHLLETDQGFLKKCHKRFQSVYVDEYQDLNQGQHRIIQALAPPAAVCVIGDPDQSIYGFRGADEECFARFSNTFPNARVFHLNRNYRSSRTIQDASHQVIKSYQRIPPEANAESVEMFTNVQGGKTITIMQAASARAEAVMIGKTIERMTGGLGFHSMDYDRVSSDDDSQSFAFTDFAVLYRSHTQSLIIADVFEKANIPFQIASKDNIFHRKGITELIALLKIIDEMGSYTDFEKIADCLNFKVGKKAARLFKNRGLDREISLIDASEKIRETSISGLSQSGKMKLIRFWERIDEMKRLTASMSVMEKLQFLIKRTGIQKMIEANPRTQEIMADVFNLAGAYTHDAAGFISAAALQTDTDIYKARAEKVTLMTMHAAKGLEFAVVFISGCEDGYIPFQKISTTASDIDEERRLFYVAMTRAKEHLLLSYAAKRTVYGKQKSRILAPFAADIEERLITYEKANWQKNNKKRATQLGLF